MPLMPVDNAAQNASTDNNLRNRFSSLAVYEPSQAFLDAPTIKRPAKTLDDKSVYEAEAETSFEHAIFPLAAVTHDMNSVPARI
jgi:hypothetical protein